MPKKKRLDHLIHEQMPQYSRQQIQSWIMQGKVIVNGRVVSKPGTAVYEEAEIIVKAEEPKYVSRAGYKLEHALDSFSVDVNGLVVLDAGISTGGFTDCLLQRGAAKVYGIDVGYGQVAEKIRRDKRVILLERTNLRHLRVSDIGEQVDCITLDLSFISLLKVMDAVVSLLKDDGFFITLIKPQFESHKGEVGRGGIITDPAIHKAIVNRIIEGIEYYGFSCMGLVESPILGAAGNKEFLALFKRKQ
jgi:23S rRNA (cytidine1920-2'-O)/16S rRNA (cytidine1409-2'-O)-methyltransferase